jgi:hypothetical protein
MFLLCGYRPDTSLVANVYIFGLYETLEDAQAVQKKDCGQISKINTCWRGHNGIITWIKQLDKGTFIKSVDIKFTGDAM